MQPTLSRQITKQFITLAKTATGHHGISWVKHVSSCPAHGQTRGFAVNFARILKLVLNLRYLYAMRYKSFPTNTAQRPDRSPVPKLTLTDIRQHVAADMDAVDATLRAELRSEVALINQIADYIIGNGGKRLRPLLVLLSAQANGFVGTHQHTLAAVVELIHTATLLHDDVVDESGMRRGKQTANAVFGNAASVLVGDFLYSRAFQMMVSIGNLRVQTVLADATNIIAEGEVLQLLNIGNTELDEADYLNVIRFKTAKLFEAASRLGAIISGVDADTEAQFARFGMHLGTAFQIIDDVLDYSGDAGAIGKNVGDDLAEGKLTLPVIYALERAPAADIPALKVALAKGDVGIMPQLLDLMARTDAVGRARQLAHAEVTLALAALPEALQQSPLAHLAHLAVARDA